MHPDALAQTALRLGRKRGLTFRVAYGEPPEPVLHVSPKQRLTTWLQEAIRLSKPALIALLEREGLGTCTAADGTVWHQHLTRCGTCGACDWGIIGQEAVQGETVNVWGCQTCRADTPALEQDIHPLLCVARAAQIVKET